MDKLKAWRAYILARIQELKGEGESYIHYAADLRYVERLIEQMEGDPCLKLKWIPGTAPVVETISTT